MTAHCVALLVRRVAALPWVADFRDSRSAGRRGPLEAALDRRLERRVVRTADAVLATTEAHADELRRRYGAEIASKVCVLPRDASGFLEAVRRCLESGRLPAERRLGGEKSPYGLLPFPPPK